MKTALAFVSCCCRRVFSARLPQFQYVLCMRYGSLQDGGLLLTPLRSSYGVINRVLSICRSCHVPVGHNTRSGSRLDMMCSRKSFFINNFKLFSHNKEFCTYLTDPRHFAISSITRETIAAATMMPSPTDNMVCSVCNCPGCELRLIGCGCTIHAVSCHGTRSRSSMERSVA
jgi:hypothetical protein